MNNQHSQSTGREWGLTEYVIMSLVLVAFVAMWAVFVTAPPRGLVSPIGMALGFVAGTYLMFIAFSYVKNNIEPETS